MFRPVRQRLVRTHPVTGRKSLYLSSHAGTIVGWPMPEARAFCATSPSTPPSRGSSTRTSGGQRDFVMWDNRQTMHRVRRFDDASRATCAAPPSPATRPPAPRWRPAERGPTRAGARGPGMDALVRRLLARAGAWPRARRGSWPAVSRSLRSCIRRLPRRSARS